ncbi:MAG TPA: UDP-N-acetylglucosamine--N-acetylmuramyl-(pentapeptide) pyrophosphoryl-undecaprenol N-acetylglucosamine transferase [Candidatus Paceibacterota bacterium]
MKILFTGGGTGGHFYPIIAMVEEMNTLIEKNKYVSPKYYYMGDDPYDEKALFEYNIEFIGVPAGKLRRYFSIKNFFDLFATGWGIIVATWKLFFLFPDVIVGKGGYSSFPCIFAARLLRIPVVVHESDAVPGRVNLFARKFAKRIGIAYEEAAQYFPKDKTALVGVPIRREILHPIREGAREFLKLSQDVPVILILGGSTGAQAINDVVFDILPELVSRYQIIHQVGVKNLAEAEKLVPTLLKDNPNKDRYKMFGFLNASALSMAAGTANLVVNRAGSTLIFEIAAWGLPAIVIPIPKEVSHDQHRNAYNYARTGAAILIEESNLAPHILLSEIDRIMGSKVILSEMSDHAKAFARPQAGQRMAEAILEIALSHEK